MMKNGTKGREMTECWISKRRAQDEKNLGKTCEIVRKYEEGNQNGPIPLNEQNFDLDKSRQKFYHSLKEHHKMSKLVKFRTSFVAKCCKMRIR
jgi:hypothetical protein